MNREERDDLLLRGWFRDLREAETGPASTYASLTRGADGREGAASPLRAGTLLVRVAGLALAASVLAMALRGGWRRPGGPDGEALRLAASLSRWQAPTDFLLATPGIDFLRSTPRLGNEAETLTGERIDHIQTEVSR